MTSNFTLYKTLIKDNDLVKVYVAEAAEGETEVSVEPIKFKRYNPKLKAQEALIVHTPKGTSNNSLDIFLNAKENWIFKLLKEKNLNKQISYDKELIKIFCQEIREITNKLINELSSLHKVEIKVSDVKWYDRSPRDRSLAYVIPEEEKMCLSRDLIRVPKYILESTIYHELCHLVQFAQEGDTNHDENFYKLADLDPNEEDTYWWNRNHDIELFDIPSDTVVHLEDNEKLLEFRWLIH